MASDGVLNKQQLGKHAGKSATKPAKVVQPSGRTSGYAEVVAERPNSSVNAGYLPRHSKTGWSSDTEPDHAGKRTNTPFNPAR